MKTIDKIISLDRDDMTDYEKNLFIKDIKSVTNEYFEHKDDITMEVTRADGGFLVCIIFTAGRIKSVKRPV